MAAKMQAARESPYDVTVLLDSDVFANSDFLHRSSVLARLRKQLSNGSPLLLTSLEHPGFSLGSGNLGYVNGGFLVFAKSPRTDRFFGCVQKVMADRVAAGQRFITEQDAQNMLLAGGTMRSMPYRLLPPEWTCRLADLKPHPAWPAPNISRNIGEAMPPIPCVFVHAKPMAQNSLDSSRENFKAGVCPFAAVGAAPVVGHTHGGRAAVQRHWVKLDDIGHAPMLLPRNVPAPAAMEAPLSTTKEARASEGSSAQEGFPQWMRGLPGNFPAAKVIWLHIPKTGSTFENILFRAACRVQLSAPFQEPSDLKALIRRLCPNSFEIFENRHCNCCPKHRLPTPTC